ncbi:unnamed protein product [Fraxinus pennsylvanica]|uniref:Uncharacterized protein n=1 Tax=Fraxinus pennsylvanica TaxID=56036 RepID=A0AAD1ZEH3_9LAMI|nr:unnamed protein product [Fraxinus pennsylvanica]
MMHDVVVVAPRHDVVRRQFNSIAMRISTHRRWDLVQQWEWNKWTAETGTKKLIEIPFYRKEKPFPRTTFRTAFAPTRNPNPNSDIIVTASNDGSVGSYSISSCLALDCGNARGQNWLVAEPHCLIQGHNGPAYDVKFSGNDEDSLLLSCGDDGKIRGWKWKEILECEVPMQGAKLKPVLDLVNPQHKGSWGALSPIPENNAIAVDSQGGSIYATAVDS